jgi:hypothetical protein
MGSIVSAKIDGELGKSEISQMQAPALEASRRCGKISALFILEDFRGWSRERDWDDISFLIDRTDAARHLCPQDTMIGDNNYGLFDKGVAAKSGTSHLSRAGHRFRDRTR